MGWKVEGDGTSRASPMSYSLASGTLIAALPSVVDAMDHIIATPAQTATSVGAICLLCCFYFTQWIHGPSPAAVHWHIRLPPSAKKKSRDHRHHPQPFPVSMYPSLVPRCPSLADTMFGPHPVLTPAHMRRTSATPNKRVDHG